MSETARPRPNEQRAVGTHRVVVVEDESTIRQAIARMLTAKGCDVEPTETAEQALALLRAEPSDVVLMDIVLPGMNGLDALAEIKRISPEIEVVIMTSHASVATAIQAIRDGAYDYLQKPFEELEEVWTTVHRALEKRNLARRNQELLQEKEQHNRALAHAVSRLNSVVEAERAMSELCSLDQLLDYFIQFVTGQLDVDRASLMLIDEQTNQLRIAGHRGIEEIDVESVRVQLGEGIAGSVASTGDPFLVTDVETDTRVSDDANPDLANSFLSVPIVLSIPLRSSSKILGVVNLTNRQDGRPFDSDDLQFVIALGSHLAVTIEKLRQLEQIERAYNSLKTTQEQLLFSERLKVIGEMAAGMAHDFKNLLSVISGRAQLIKIELAKKSGDRKEMQRKLDTIIKTAIDGANVVKRLRSYTDPDKEAHSAFMVQDAIRDAVEMTQPKWKEECEAQDRPVQVQYEFDETPAACGNRGEITQLVGNLIFNAVEAMPEGGSMTFKTRGVDDSVELSVQDSGIGMDDATRGRAFEPFFTTKSAGQGLGMAIIQSIVMRHRGNVSVDSTQGQGTTFTVQLPMAKEACEPAETEPATAKPTPRAVSVLLVDDDDLVRDTYEEALQAHGHQVLAANSGSQAVQFLDHMDFQVVVTDLSMGAMSGIELARFAKKKDPAMPVILLTGFADDFAGDRVQDAGVDRVLEKPCLFEDLIEAIDVVLEG